MRHSVPSPHIQSLSSPQQLKDTREARKQKTFLFIHLFIYFFRVKFCVSRLHVILASIGDAAPVLPTLLCCPTTANPTVPTQGYQTSCAAPLLLTLLCCSSAPIPAMLGSTGVAP